MTDEKKKQMARGEPITGTVVLSGCDCLFGMTGPYHISFGPVTVTGPVYLQSRMRRLHGRMLTANVR